MSKIPSQIVNPNGLHQRYYIQKIVLEDGSLDWSDRNGGERGFPKFVKKPVDKDAEYFVMRLDEGGKDANHIKACRIGVNAYANAIEPFIPGLAKDLKERYPIESEPTPSVESMEDVLKDALSKDGLGISLSTEDRILSAMQHWASIKCAEKDREIAELRQLKEVTELALSSSANTIEDMEQELSTKEEAVKELVEGLDVSLRAMTGLVRQLPVDESLADYNLDFCEIAEQAAKQLITKHKTP